MNQPLHYIHIITDGFQFNKGPSESSQEIFLATAAEFDLKSKWSGREPTVLPICVCLKSTINQKGRNMFTGLASHGLEHLAKGVKMHCEHLDEEVIVVAVPLVFVGDTPARYDVGTSFY